MPKKALNIGVKLIVKSSSSPRPIKSPAIPSYTIIRGSAVDQEDLKPFSEGCISLLFTRFSKTLLTTERRLTGC